MSEPKLYRKLPVEIYAVEFDGTNGERIERWTGGDAKVRQPDIDDGGPKRLLIHTREGAVFAEPGDFIIRGVQGEHYPCGGDIFRQTYEDATEPQAEPGRTAFETYNAAVGGTTFDGKPLTWDMIGPRQRDGWHAVEQNGRTER